MCICLRRRRARVIQVHPMAWHGYLGGRLSEYGHVWIDVFLEHLHFVRSMVLIALLGALMNMVVLSSLGGGSRDGISR